MKIGVISDVHADLASLIKALKIFKQVEVNMIVCAGDLVEKGDQGNQVVALIHRLKIPCVLGNHDEMAIGNQQWIKENMDLSNRHIQNSLLNSDTLDYLDQLPRKLRFEWEGIRVLLVHGSPASNVEYLRPTTPASQFADHAKNARATIIICGHSHTVMHYISNQVHFINPGSVLKGVSSHTCGVLTLPEIQLTVYQLDDATAKVVTPQIPQ